MCIRDSREGDMALGFVDSAFGGLYRYGDLAMDLSYEGGVSFSGETSVHMLVFRLDYVF